MEDIFKNDKEFKEAIGAYIIAFSELEFGLASLCTATEFDLRLKNNHLMKYMGFSFDKKMKHLSDFINTHLIELKPTWDIIKNEVGQLNRERRFLAHGFMSYTLPRETITTHIKENGKIVTQNQTLKKIKNLTNRLEHVKTGKNGINGEFHTEFMKARINKWNELVNDYAKITYKINNKIVSDWKGKP
ncbi:hypothetical protein [Tenacibaculum bernardetii]|uniref:hypothetical protein n=1 Tax=Tenacibaculum bernardetii TaxID=3021375 RepID=UPI0023B0A08A|nr:hypothetical protein [Tenacibaculum bernardetii]